MKVEQMAPVVFNIPPATNDWITWGYNQERTGWNRAETTLTPKKVSHLKQVWSTQLSVPVDKYVLSTMTAPVVVAGVPTSAGPKDMLFILGANNVVFALDANSGQVLWQKSYPNPQLPRKPK